MHHQSPPLPKLCNRKRKKKERKKGKARVAWRANLKNSRSRAVRHEFQLRVASKLHGYQWTDPSVARIQQEPKKERREGCFTPHPPPPCVVSCHARRFHKFPRVSSIGKIRRRRLGERGRGAFPLSVSVSSLPLSLSRRAISRIDTVITGSVVVAGYHVL